MKKQPIKLPDKPSALIRLALRDLEKCERSKKFTIDMSTWFEPNGTCRVCLAGSVMAQSLKCSTAHELVPCMTDIGDRDLCDKLDALNEFRCGAVADALDVMEAEPASFSSFEVCPYESSGTKFKRDMLKLATLLAKEGL